MVRRVASVVLFGAVAACSRADNPPPKVTAVAPAVVARTSATPAWVEGQGFYGSARVDLGSDTPLEVTGSWIVAVDDTPLPASDTALASASAIAIVIPSGLSLGEHAVTVTSPSGQSDTLQDAFSVVDCVADCGDKVCCPAAGETAGTCPQDCKAICPDGFCTGTENAVTCPRDCKDRCGDGVCTGNENAEACPSDCPTMCPDGVCTGSETAATCPQDCAERCGDGACTGSETAATCPQDCEAVCGDGFCTHTETAAGCAQDCTRCGDGACTGTETAATCATDCPASCGDGACTGTENASSCPQDCAAKCPDGFCTQPENASSCPQDCAAKCPDGFCTHTENACTCPQDCAATCGDRCCSATETTATCAVDCPASIAVATDAYTRQQFPTENHGGDTDIRAGSGSTIARANRAMVAFDVSGITCNVKSATLRLYYYAEDFVGVSIVLEAHRLTSPWLALETTWNRASNATAWTSPGGDFDPAVVATAPLGASAFGWVSWNVTQAVSQWLSGTPNYGLILIEANDNQGNLGRKFFYSKDVMNAALRPSLVVDCSP